MTAFLPIIAAACTSTAVLAGSFQFTQVNPFQSNGIEEIYLWDVNEAGESCGTSTSGSFYDGFFRLPSGEKSVVPITWPRGLNNVGTVVGGATVATSQGGITAFIPTLSHGVFAQNVNDHGVVVGYIVTCSCSNSNNNNQIPFYWSSQLGTRTIALPGSKELLAVNNSNVAVGNIRNTSEGSFAFVYKIDTNEIINLGRMLTPTGPAYSRVLDIAENGVVTGDGYDGAQTRAFIWKEGEGFTFLPGLDGGPADSVSPRSVNSAKQVVGWARNGANAQRAFLWDPVNGMRDLNTLVQGKPADFRMERALAISETGWIVGDGKIGPGFGVFRAWTVDARSTGCPGDFNGDFVVNFADLNAVLSGFGAAYTFSDLNQVLSAFGQNCPTN